MGLDGPRRQALFVPTSYLRGMTEKEEEPPVWDPGAITEQWQQAGEEAMERQLSLFQKLLTSGQTDGIADLSRFSTFGMGAATFKARVQSGGRISIPDAEREALDIHEGDIVQTIVVPVKRERDEAE